jgi:hypothetical protein
MAPGSDYPPLLQPRGQKHPLWRRVLLVAGALLCFVVGVFGWLLPVVTGIPFYIVGLILLGMASPRVIEWINRAEASLSPRWRGKLRMGLDKIPFKGLRKGILRPSNRHSD